MQANTAPLTVRLEGLRVAITAGAGGIGRALADGYASCGARVFLCDVDAEALAACPLSVDARRHGNRARAARASSMPPSASSAGSTCWSTMPASPGRPRGSRT